MLTFAKKSRKALSDLFCSVSYSDYDVPAPCSVQTHREHLAVSRSLQESLHQQGRTQTSRKVSIQLN